MIPDEVVQDILKRTNIVDVISSYIQVVKKGNSYKAVCPFHNDTNPSMSIKQDLGIYNCFSCHAAGNAFSFVAKYENISYVQAIKKVAGMISYNHPSLNDNSVTFIKKNVNLINALNDTKDFYHYMIKTNLGKDGYDYFIKRGIDDKMIDYFSLGYSPSNSSLLIKTLESKNHDILTLDKAGVTTRENGKIVDLYHSRVIFPIYNENDDVIGFSGRLITGEGPKYVNTYSTEVFNKSAVLYNYQNAKLECKKVKYVYVVEGFMDVFALYKAGILSSIALMGTAFTKEHVKMLRMLNVEVRIMLDGDNPGQEGILKMTHLLDGTGINYKVVDYKGIKLDPDEIFNELGKEELIKIANQLITPTAFLIKHLAKKYNLNSIDEKVNYIKELGPRIKFYKTRVEQEEYIKLLAKVTNVSVNSIYDLVKEYISSNLTIVKEETISYPHIKMNSSLINTERELLFQMLNNRSVISDFIARKDLHFDDDIYGLLYNYVLDAYDQNIYFDVSLLINQLEKNEAKNKELIKTLVDLMSIDHPPYEKVMIDEMMDNLLKELKKKQKRRRTDLFLDKAKFMSPLEASKKIQEITKNKD